MNGKKLKQKWKMTIKEVLKKYNKVEIELLLAHILKKPREFLYLNPERKLTNKQFGNLAKYIRRREKGEPIAYILGYKDFMGLRIKVNKDVLIPRSETEGMVEHVVQALGLPAFKTAKQQATGLPYKNTVSILDIGTGSGCIAIAIAKQLQNFKFKISNLKLTAIDISSAALKVAKANAKYHQAKVKFIKSDLLANIKGNFDIIVANLPYGWLKWKNNTSSETIGLKFEPKEALFTKENGLFEIRRLLEQISSLKYQPKFIYLEFDPRQKPELSKLIKKILPGYRAEFFKDLNNFWRFVEIKHSNILQNVGML
jgi:release factor glutamine methyltransferase